MSVDSRRWTSTRLGLGFLGLAAVITAIVLSQRPPVDPNVVIVTLDTTRADALGAYGAAQANTPTLDAMAAGGARFDRAYSPMPLTIPAHATLFTGLNPYNNGVRDNDGTTLGEEHSTLAEYLRIVGWQTAASISAFVTHSRWGLAQGFDDYYDTLPAMEGANPYHLRRDAGSVVDDALGWWSARDPEQPAMVWLHFYDAHHPLVPPESFLAAHEHPYDAAIAYMDSELARFKATVDADDRPTLWVIAGDHGESMGEHGEIAHGWYSYNATQHVPLILNGPGVEPGVHEAPVGLVDVMPTVLSLLNLPVPEGLDGHPQPGAPHPIYLETYVLLDRFGYAPHVAVVDGDWKLVATPRPELYDQRGDVNELNDAAADHPETVAQLQAILTAFNAAPPTGNENEATDAETLQRLQSLGYMSGLGTTSSSPDDPKDHPDVLAALSRADLAIWNGDGHEAMVEPLLEALALDESLDTVRLMAATGLLNLDRTEEAVAQVERVLEARADDAQVMMRVMNLYAKAGEFERAIAMAEEALESGQLPAMREGVLMNLINVGQPAEAARRGMSWVEDPIDDPALSGHIGVALMLLKRHDEALEYLMAGMDAPVIPQNVRLALAEFAETREDAVTWIQSELAAYPNNRLALEELLRVYEAGGDIEGALEQVESLLMRWPNDPRYLDAHTLLMEAL